MPLIGRFRNLIIVETAELERKFTSHTVYAVSEVSDDVFLYQAVPAYFCCQTDLLLACCVYAFKWIHEQQILALLQCVILSNGGC